MSGLQPLPNFRLEADSKPKSRSTSAVVATALIAGLLVVAGGSFGPNVGLALLAASVLAFGIMCLWRQGDPPILLLAFLFQWLQGSVAIFLATFAGRTIDDFYLGAGPVAEATVLTLAALVAMAMGMRLGAGPLRHDLQQHARAMSAQYSMRTWFVLYAISVLVGIAALTAIQFASGLSQILYALNSLHWAFFFMLATAHFSRGLKAGAWFYAAFAFELATSIGGYFSDFKTVFFITFIAIVMAGIRISASRILGAAFVAAVAFGLGVVWTAVKGDYRQYVSGGEAAQIVTAGYPERIQKLGELVGELDQERLGAATEDLFSRISYVEFFGSTLAYVPSVAPHENGELLLDAIERPFTPRIFFPDKAEIDDSERTRYYTGRSIAGAEQGTSISLGWMAEMYIDFGRWGMMLAVAGVGLFYGLIYRFLTIWTWSRGLLGYAVASALLLPTAMLESSITKVIGGLIASLLVAAVVIRFVVPLWRPRAGR